MFKTLGILLISLAAVMLLPGCASTKNGRGQGTQADIYGEPGNPAELVMTNGDGSVQMRGSAILHSPVAREQANVANNAIDEAGSGVRWGIGGWVMRGLSGDAASVENTKTTTSAATTQKGMEEGTKRLAIPAQAIEPGMQVVQPNPNVLQGL